MQQSRSELMGMSGQNILRDERFRYMQPAYLLDEANNINMLQSLYNGGGCGILLFHDFVSVQSQLQQDNRYIVTATFRRDGSSKFSDENRYSNSFALGWNIANEDFMHDIRLITALKSNS